ncbi:recombination regulator RecX [Tepidibacter hydrothermalis]|uniref:Regulatory protein RecX n=1 Tax=Tepidibacter hydrothermalis TaxID=3036126 RepID=A0ABY8EEZ7_9FIRM|nr:recombination regulator RecX [Tepidibacter hydrothermalis]WFD11529.1 recombination regulator RecX [Tepidibacter hydrothermalis]
MPKITKIEEQKNKDRVNIYVDDEFFIGIYADLVYTLKLKKGNDIDKESVQKIIDDEMYLKAKNKALNILSRAPQSQKNIVYKLSKNEFNEKTIDRVLDFLKEYKFIDDEILAKNMVKDKLNINKYGKNRIKQALYSKGIDSSTINTALESEVDEDKEFENALYLGNKRYEKIKNEDKNKIYQKLSSHLTYKGFGYDTVRKVVNKIMNTEF